MPLLAPCAGHLGARPMVIVAFAVGSALEALPNPDSIVSHGDGWIPSPSEPDEVLSLGPVGCSPRA